MVFNLNAALQRFWIRAFVSEDRVRVSFGACQLWHAAGVERKGNRTLHARRTAELFASSFLLHTKL